MHKLMRKWWPTQPNKEIFIDKLSNFYSQNSSYHDMTALSGKLDHPQVRLLMTLVKNGMSYAEVGCGGGEVSGAVASVAAIHGFDVSSIAISNASQRYGGSNAVFTVAPAENLPLNDSSVDGVYSFEALEHLWNPVQALQEMVRVVKPGGFIFVSCPNHFSLDLYLNKRPIVRLVEMACAATRYVQDKLTGVTFVNLIPNLDIPEVYPDCDMVSSLIPANITGLMGQLGCRVLLLDTFYMCAHKSGNAADLQLMKYSAKPFFKWFGDHILLHSVKK